MNILHGKYPGFKPHALVSHKQDFTLNTLELISYPFEEEGVIYITTRVKNDPTILNKHRIEDLELLKERNCALGCYKCGKQSQICEGWEIRRGLIYCDACLPLQCPNCNDKNIIPLGQENGFNKYECFHCHTKFRKQYKKKVHVKGICPQCKSNDTKYYSSDFVNYSNDFRTLHQCNNCNLNFYVYPLEHEKMNICQQCPDKSVMIPEASDQGGTTYRCMNCNYRKYISIKDNMVIQNNMITHETGAKRTSDADHVRFDLISPIGLRRLAMIYKEGAIKYGDYNWEKGFSISDLLNHGINHYNLYMEGSRDEDHLAKLAWAAFAAMHSEEQWPELNKNLRGPGCKAPNK